MGITYVDDWRPKDESEVYLISDNKLVIIPFNKILGIDMDVKTISSFIVKKAIYTNTIHKIIKYTNYFINNYDYDKEIIMAYLKIKYMIDDSTREISKKAFIKMIYSYLFTPTIIDKIKKMVDDNYIISLKKDDGKKYDEDMEFTDVHGKIFYRISVAINLFIPLLNHFLVKKNIEQKILYEFFLPLFDLMSEDGVDIVNKLSNYVLKKLQVNFEGNKGAWDQRSALGDANYLEHSEFLLRKIIVTDVLHKFVFNDNIISFLTSVINNNLKFHNRGEYPYLPKILSEKKDMEGLSEIDKFEMLFNKIDESISILSECNKKSVLRKLEEISTVTISQEEIDYYKVNYNFDSFNTNLVKYYFAKWFNGYRDLNMLTREQFVKLLIILKRRLLAHGFVYLPIILSANVKTKLNTRTIQNKKFIQKVESSSLYQELINVKYAYIINLKDDNIILNIISTALNTIFTYVEYNAPHLLGEKVEVVQDILCEELLSFLNQI